MTNKDVVLVVEDEDLVRDSIVLDLKDAGFDVIAAGTGDEASFLLPKMERIDLLLTDIRMPGRINGWVLADMARCRRPNLPVIYTSGFASQEAAKVEGSFFLSKPYRTAQILAAFGKLKICGTTSTSVNMRSKDEDLEISNPGLQSSYKKLLKENAKLKALVHELNRSNGEMTQHWEKKQIATIVLDRNLDIKRFNPAAKHLFFLVESDVGRSISRISSLLPLDWVHQEAILVLRTLSPFEGQIESQDRLDRYWIRILPYSTLGNGVAGVTINFLDLNGAIPLKPRSSGSS
jgi:CheY-like chemotaxis protein